MKRIILITLFIFCTAGVFAQNDFLVFKKKDKTVQRFFKNSCITFQLNDREWIYGIITNIENDSFYLTKVVIQVHLMGSDTFYFSGFHYALSDIYAMPKKGVQVHYVNGHYEISRAGGHVHWFWIKNGWLFSAGGAGYALLHVLNGVTKKEYNFSGKNLGIAGGVFSAGVLLRYLYKPVLRTGRNYRLAVVKVSG